MPRPPATNAAPAVSCACQPGVRLLALDTATERLAVALADGEAEVLLNAEGGALASTTLLPTVLAQLAERQMKPTDLQAIAFGCGPGAFTGLRTAVSVAQGLAFGIGCPVLPICSLLIVAEDAREQAGVAAGEPYAVWVAMDARMDEVYAAAYRFDGVRWHETSAPALYDLPTLQAVWQSQPPMQVAGTALTAFAGRLSFGAAVAWPQVANRAAALLRLARRAWADDPHLPAEQALPLYLRDKVALTTAEREAARTAAEAAP
jgi:tRNA threonylcarbamoyladenosine biosynthesis protein TsaB